MKKKWSFNQEQVEFNWNRSDEDFHFDLEGKSFNGRLVKRLSPEKIIVELEGKLHTISKVGSFISVGPKTIVAEDLMALKKSSAGGGVDEGMSSPMPGKILKVMVAKGDKVEKGQGLLVMEAMKMEHTIKASYDGVVANVHYREGELIDGGVELVDLEQTEKDKA